MNVKEIRNSIQNRLAHNGGFRSVNYLCVHQSPVTLRKQNRKKVKLKFCRFYVCLWFRFISVHSPKKTKRIIEINEINEIKREVNTCGGVQRTMLTQCTCSCNRARTHVNRTCVCVRVRLAICFAHSLPFIMSRWKKSVQKFWWCVFRLRCGLWSKWRDVVMTRWCHSSNDTSTLAHDDDAVIQSLCFLVYSNNIASTRKSPLWTGESLCRSRTTHFLPTHCITIASGVE